MKRTMLVVACLALAGAMVAAQSKPRVTWGDPVPLEDDDDTVEDIRLPEGNYLTLQYSLGGILGKQVTARLFNRDGKQVKEEKFKFQSQSTAFFKVRPQVEKLIEFRGRHYFLLRELDYSGRRTMLHSWAFDPATLTVAKEPVTIASVEMLDLRLMSYHWAFNQEGDTLYVLEAPGRGESAAANMTIKAYDPDLKRLWEKRFALPPDVEFPKVTSFGVEHGHEVIASRSYEKRPGILGRTPPYKQTYFILPEGATELARVSIDLPGMQAYDAKHRFEGQNRFLFYGVYSKSTEGKTAGAFFLRYGVGSAKPGTVQMRPFPASILESADLRDKRMTDAEYACNFKVAHVHMRPDGGLQFIAEQSNSYWLSYSLGNWDGSMALNVSGTLFQFDDIMLYTLYEDPSRDWFSLIRKRQMALGVNRDFSFTHKYDKDGTVWMLYNDLPDNLKLPPSKQPADLKDRHGKMGTVLARIDPKGNVSRELLFTRKDTDHWFAPRQTKYLDDGTVLLSSFGKKSYRVGSLSLPQ
jgi:hypothetical protein